MPIKQLINLERTNHELVSHLPGNYNKTYSSTNEGEAVPSNQPIIPIMQASNKPILTWDEEEEDEKNYNIRSMNDENHHNYNHTINGTPYENNHRHLQQQQQQPQQQPQNSNSVNHTPTLGIGNEFMECQIQMLRQVSSPSKVLKLLDIFLEMKLNKDPKMREAFCDTSVCYHLPQMINETPPKLKNLSFFNNDRSERDSLSTTQTDNRSAANVIFHNEYDEEDGDLLNDHDSFIDGDYIEEQDEEIVRKGCKLITDLTHNDTTGYFIQQFAKNGTVDILTKRMKQFPNNEALQEEICTVMLFISFADFDNHYSYSITANNGFTTSATTLTRVFNDSVLNILCATMKRYPKNRNLQGSIMNCLRMIATKCQVIQDVIIERCQFLDVILKNLKLNWKKSSKLVQNACEVLKVLASNPKEDARALIRQKKGTMLFAEIEDHYRATGKDQIADIALDVFTIVCKKYYFPTVDFGSEDTATTDTNNHDDEIGGGATTTSHHNTTAATNGHIHH